MRVPSNRQPCSGYGESPPAWVPLLDELPGPAAVLTREGGLECANASFAELIGLGERDAFGKTFWELPCVREAGRLRNAFAEVVATSSARRVEQSWAGPGGSTVRLSLQMKLVSSGDHVMVVASVQDTAPGQGGAVARDARAKAFLNVWPDLIFRLDASGMFLEFYAPDPSQLAVPTDKIVGHKLEELLPPDVAQSSLDTLRRALATGRIEIHEYALEIAGELQYFEARHVACGEGEVVAVVRDITPRKRDEEALRRSEESFRALIERSPDMIVVHRHGRVVYANEQGARQLGFDHAGQLVGASVLDIVHPEDRPLATARIRRMLATGESAPVAEERIMRRDGTLLYAEVAAIPLAFQGEPAIIVIAHDVTARKRAERERAALESRIQHAQKLESLGVLAGGIAHDFNNLLMGVLGNAGLALMQLPNENPARESLKRIETAGKRAADLTRQLLAYSGKGKFVVELIDLSRLVHEMIHLLETVISKRASLRLHLASGLPLVEADPSQVSQVVMNLITNASDAIGETNGVISITTGTLHADRAYLTTTAPTDDLAEGQYVFLEVSDTGLGMDAATVSRIFDPFFTTKFTGRGLGLAAVLGIVRGHHGAIKVYSEPGRGTTFKVLLPSSSKSVSDTPPSAPPPSKVEEHYRVLVVDDDEMARSLAQSLLEHFGFAVLTADNGQQGVDMVRERGDAIDVVLLDMTMPVMSGEEAFRAMRQARPGLQVVLTSGYNEQDAIARFSGKGLAGFIQKPYLPAELVDKIRSAAARLRRRG